MHQIILHETQTRMQRLYRVVTRTENGIKSVVSRTLIEERPLSIRQFTAKASRSTYDNVSSYLADMGISAALMPLLLATPPSGIHWLTRDEEKTTKLVTDLIDGEYIVAKTGHIDQPAASDRTQVLGTSVPEEAFLIVASSETTRPKVSIGRVTWRIEKTETPSDVGPNIVLHSDTETSEAGMRVSMNISHPVGTNAALLIDVAFSPSPNGQIHAVERIGLPIVRVVNPSQTSTLPGTVRTSGGNSFQIRLTGDQAQMQQLLEQRPWIDIPMQVDGGVAAKLTLEHAASGTPLLQQAFQAWKDQRPHGDPSPISAKTMPN